MQYNQLEAYENGHYAGLDLSLPPLPPWARELNCEYSGLWVYISAQSFLQTCKHITVQVPPTLNVYLEVAPPPKEKMQYTSFLRDLEMKGLNLLGYAHKLELECFGATGQYSKTGQFYLAGLFAIHNTLDTEGNHHSFTVKSRLMFPDVGAHYKTILSNSLVPYFKVEVKATMDPTEAIGKTVLTYDSGNPLFGFFGLDEGVQPEVRTTKIRSKSFLEKLSNVMNKS